MSAKRYTTAAKAKLATSALELADAKALGITELNATQTKRLFKHLSVPALKLNYYDLRGKLRRDTYRIRLLAEPKGQFGEKAEKPRRYVQPPGSPPAAYLPRTIDWLDVAIDTETTIVITEGELKAACAAKHGLKCIGLGGVSSWRSAKLGWPMLPELEEMVWSQRDVVICFDADSATNPDVAAATGALVNALVQRGALPRVAQLSMVNGDPKTGLDDLIVARGFDAFMHVVEAAEGDELARALWGFNERFAYVMDPGLVYDEEQDQRHRPTDFKNAALANVWATRQDGDRLRRVQVAPAWIEWLHRRQVKAITYAPAQSRFIDGRLNAWTGWGCEPKAGSVKLWKQLLTHIFTGASPAELQWFERWALYPLKHPGAKLLSAVGVWSLNQGVGKSMIGETLGRIYGDNYSLISQRDLESQFNGWAVHKQFVMVDDVSQHDSRAKADLLKKVITQRSCLVNVKYLPTYALPDCANYYLTSNRSNAFYLENRDRRFFIHEVVVKRREMAFYERYMNWLRGPGPGALLNYALHDFDFGDFNPHRSPPETRAKTEMVNSVKSELGLWLTELKEDPDGRLRVGDYKLKRDLFTAGELVAFFEQIRKGPPVASNIMGLLAREYFSPAAQGNTLRVDGLSERFIIVRNVKSWLTATRKELVDHVIKHRERESGRSGGKF